MPRTRVKICCIASAEELALAAAMGADLAGLVGPMPSGPGILSLAGAARIAAATPPWLRPVLLTASETAEAIAADAAAAGVSTVQVVRHIARAEAERLAAGPLGYIQVVHVEGAEAVATARLYAPLADALLLDSGRPGAGELGGTGRRHDWSVSRTIVADSPAPVFLAGGLTPENAGEAVRAVRPFGLDICSGLRPEGALDRDLLTRFLAAITEADSLP